MGILSGKKGLILGVANQKSIAWGIAQACAEEGAELGFTFLNESMDKRVRPLAESVDAKLIVECDVQNDDHLKKLYDETKASMGEIDFIIHSVAFASGDDLKGRFHETSRAGFALAMDVSAYSLVAVSRELKPLLKEGGSIVNLSYLGATSVVPNYRVMGVAKAALEACTRELAADLGQDGIRVNSISAGPIRTLAASGISSFKSLLNQFEERAPLKRLTTIEDCGKSAVYLVSDLSQAVTGEVHFVDCGFNITAL